MIKFINIYGNLMKSFNRNNIRYWCTTSEIDYHRSLRVIKQSYYMDPKEVSRRIFRVFTYHQAVKNAQEMTLNSQWHELGINQLDYVQIMIGIENQFRIEFPDETLQKFKDINDIVEYVSRSFWSV